MKKTILSIITLLAVVFGTSGLSYADTLNTAVVTTLADISAINNIEVHGNVTLYISDAPTDQVKVYNKYYSETALVQSKNGTLRITSYSPEKLVVWVSASDLRSVSAYDNATVKSFGDISNIEFNLDLHNNASAKLDLDAYSANISLSDFAKADLSGSAYELNLSHNFASTINKSNFKTTSFTENKIGFSAGISEDMVGI